MSLRRRFGLLATLLIAGALVGAQSRSSQAAPSSFFFEGGGFGHGVGMSQYGAQGMAVQGRSYREILAHYYQGTTVQTVGQPGPRIWLADDGSANPAATLSPTGPVSMQVDGRVVATAQSGQTIRIAGNAGRFDIFVNGNRVAGPVGGGASNLYVYFGGAPMRLDKTGNRYRYGTLEFNNNGSRIRIVLGDISMEQYLYGLGEVPSSWHAEALKTQAVAGRTYAKEKTERLGQNRPECSCALSSTTTDQNYIGYEKEAASGGSNWVAAVNNTAGQTVMYNGAAIQAFYSSSSGGHTEHSENVFVQSLPYLRGVPDPGDAHENPNHKWTRQYEASSLQTWLSRASDTNVGTLQSIEFLPPFGVSGRVLRVVDANRGGVKIVGSLGTKRVSGDRFRSVVNSGVASEGGGLSRQLLSTLMRVGGWSAYNPAFTGGVYVAAGPVDSSGVDRVITGAGAGGGPHVRTFDPNGSPVGGFMAYDTRFTGGVRVAACDLSGDGQPFEIITAAGPGGGPHVRVFTGNGNPIGGFMAYDPRFTGGVFVACGDVTGDSRVEIITGADEGGGPHVRVFDASGGPIGGFMAYDPGFLGGARVAAVRTAGPGEKARIVTGAGPGGGPHVRVFTGEGSPVPGTGFAAYAPSFRGGVYVAGGQIAGDARSEIITGAGEAGGPHVRVMDPFGNEVTGFAAFSTGNDHGARVAVGAFPASGVIASAGAGSPPSVRVFLF